jgi:signal transduction histidine kinase
VALAFRQRIFAWLVVIAVVPASIAIAVMTFAPQFASPAGGVEAWEEAVASWRDMRRGLDPASVSPGTRQSLQRHEAQLSVAVRRSRQAQTINAAFAGIIAAAALALAVLVFGGAVRLAGSLARQLSRPIDELVSWTHHLQRGEPLPETQPARGAPEFEVLRGAFRTMAADLEQARQRDVEAAELRAFRELARQVAHELKNPLTPIRFAVQRLAKDASPAQLELIDVLGTESARLERMAKDFGELGRLPEGPTAPVDLGELCDELAKGRPDGITVRVEKASASAFVPGHYEPLRRALHNLVLNAIDAVQERGTGAPGHRGTGEVVLGVRPAMNGAAPAIDVSVQDNGVGIPAANLPHIFEPQFTTKPAGTGLGLAIVRQTIRHHGGSIAVSSEPGRGTTFTVTLPTGAA